MKIVETRLEPDIVQHEQVAGDAQGKTNEVDDCKSPAAEDVAVGDLEVAIKHRARFGDAVNLDNYDATESKSLFRIQLPHMLESLCSAAD